jgi:MOB kinase activator 1
VCAAVDFFNQINMLYGTLTEYCTPETCPVMCAGPRYEYHWMDGVTVKKPLKCSAPGLPLLFRRSVSQLDLT